MNRKRPPYLTNYTTDLRARMQAIRSELPGDVQQARAEVHNLTDWKYYVRSYPEYLLPAVALAAYSLVPASRHSTSHSEVDRQQPSSEENVSQVQQTSLLAGLTSAAVTMATRSLVSAATRYGTQWLSQRLTPGSGAYQPTSPHTASHQEQPVP